MAADNHIRVSDRVKALIDDRRREGESYNDALERILGGERDLTDGMGILVGLRRRRRGPRDSRARDAKDRRADRRMRVVGTTFLVDYLDDHDADLTHPETRTVVDVESYRS